MPRRGWSIPTYLAGVEEGLLPHLGKDDEVGDPARAAENLATRIQEERRLMYVGITRAQRSLNLSWCKRRRRAREDVVREPSRFIEEMGLDDPAIKEDEVTAAMNPKERLGMLKALLKRPRSAGALQGRCYGPAEPDPCSPGLCGTSCLLGIGALLAGWARCALLWADRLSGVFRFFV